MFATVQGFLLPILGVNLEGAVARKYYSGNTLLSVYIGNCIMIFCFTTLISLGLFSIFSGFLESYTGVPRHWIMIIPLVCAAQFLCMLALTLWQVKEKSLRYAGFQISQSLVNALLTLILIIIFSYRWSGRLMSISLSTISFGVFVIIIFWKNHTVKFEINLSYIKHALKFGGGLVPHALGGMLILLTNRVFLTKMVSIEESGFYGVANQVCSVITFLTISFNNAYVPWLFKKLSGNNQEDKIKIIRLTYIYFVAILFIGIAYYFVQPVLFKMFVGIKFQPAMHYCFWIILGFVFQGMYFMVTNYISFAEKTYMQGFLTIFVGLLNIPLNYFCIKYFGALGAAISFAVIFCLFFLLTWILSARVYPMPWLKTFRI
jgi:O-antigen/teichoic acid export membrane protein